eukprot:8919-Heterococcus_DN1.PRE.3
MMYDAASVSVASSAVLAVCSTLQQSSLAWHTTGHITTATRVIYDSIYMSSSVSEQSARYVTVRRTVFDYSFNLAVLSYAGCST